MTVVGEEQLDIIKSFNPCFSGSYIMTMYFSPQWPLTSGFNPCFSGSYIMTYIGKMEKTNLDVSILVLVDLIL